MTQNQIAWFKAREEARHNVASEGETARHNYQDEVIRSATNDINALHYQRSDTETHRSNKVKERQTHTQLRQRNKEIQENRRHNKAAENISMFQSQEQKRHNLATEGVDWANVGIGRMNATTNQQNASTNWQNALTNMSNANLRAQELELSKDRYSLDQWNSQQSTSAQVGKVGAEEDLARAREELVDLQKEYQDMQNKTYYLDKVLKILNPLSIFTAGASVGP